MDLNCLGCQLANKLVSTKTIYEDDMFSIILDHDPINSGHLLIIPKLHFEKFTHLSNEYFARLRTLLDHYQMILKDQFGYTDFTIQINEGFINELNGHLHIHLVPRSVDDGLQYDESKLETIDMDTVFEALKNK